MKRNTAGPSAAVVLCILLLAGCAAPQTTTSVAGPASYGKPPASVADAGKDFSGGSGSAGTGAGAQETGGELPPHEYMLAHSLPVSGLAAYPVEDIGLGRFDIVLVGEFHGNTKTFEAKQALVEYLLQTEGTRHLLLEATGYMDAYLLNLYLQTGDEDILEQMAGLDSTGLANRGTYDFYRFLYSLGESDPRGPVVVYPGDLQHATGRGFFALGYLLPEQEPPPELARGLEPIWDTAALFALDTEEWYAHILENKDAYRQYLGAGWEVFLAGATALMDAVWWYTDGQMDDAYREEYMIELALNAVAQAPREKWLGLYGIYHVRMDEIADGTASQPTLGNYLANEAAETAGRVGVIAFAYHESSRLASPAGDSREIEEEYPLANEAAPLLPGDITLCRLDLPGSPFGADTSPSLLAQQYLLTVRYSEAAAPL